MFVAKSAALARPDASGAAEILLLNAMEQTTQRIAGTASNRSFYSNDRDKKSASPDQSGRSAQI